MRFRFPPRTISFFRVRSEKAPHLFSWKCAFSENTQQVVEMQFPQGAESQAALENLYISRSENRLRLNQRCAGCSGVSSTTGQKDSHTTLRWEAVPE